MTKDLHGPHAVVLLSGGLDSAVTLAVASSLNFSCHALSFDYGQRHSAELAAAAAVARALRAASHTTIPVNLRAIGASALTDDAIPVPTRPPASTTPASAPPADIPPTYVPARNLIFLSIAAALAEARSASDIFIGANAVDYSGYPDCREPFLRAFEAAANLGTRAGDQGRPFRVHAPLVNLSKAQIIRRAHDLGVDLSLTHSCYNPLPDPDNPSRPFACARCDSCLIRARGFAEAGLPDPTRYRP